MDKTKIAAAIQASVGVILALTKFEKVMQELSDSIIHETNSPIVDGDQLDNGRGPNADADVPPNGVVVDSDSAGDVQLDGEGRPWVSGIHTEKKSLVNSKNVKGAKAWRLVRNVDEKALNDFYAKYPICGATESVDGRSEPPSPNMPALPGASTLPTSPSMPALPGASTGVVEEIDPSAGIRSEIIAVLKSLIDDFDFSWDDLKEIFTEEFKVAQNGDQVVFGSIPFADYPKIKDHMNVVLAQYQYCKDAITSAYSLAKPENRQLIDDQLVAIFKAYSTDQLGGVHYSQMKGFVEYMTTWLKSWQDWASQQG